MIYDLYYCDLCDVGFEVGRSIHEKPPEHKCPSCEATLNARLPQRFNFSVRHDPQTLGHLAERNTQEMGRYELEERRIKDKLNKQEAKRAGREELSKKLPPGASLVDTDKLRKQWFRPGTDGPDMSINKLSPEKLEKYIHTGEK